MKWNPSGTEWGDYYTNTNYSKKAFDQKKQIVKNFLDKIDAKVVWDFGANTGEFSRISSKKGFETISFDIDPAAVEKNFLECTEKQEKNILPLVLDLSNPSPNIGWANQERLSLIDRGPADVIFALGLIHHLAISNNLPFDRIVSFFKKNCKHLIIEFIPKNDSQIQRLLATREDIFKEYNKENFEKVFLTSFKIKECINIAESERTLYHMEKIN